MRIFTFMRPLYTMIFLAELQKKQNMIIYSLSVVHCFRHLKKINYDLLYHRIL
ncbi:hypothetical protein D1AOALGA4SA_9832 [Olavius algarvensis Delta 1 endosymbiont]|nr:hypothetical protein D1AOALGA4SA_9832 [Olavius algarvensis Delta 1 endosymbiont]